MAKLERTQLHGFETQLHTKNAMKCAAETHLRGRDVSIRANLVRRTIGSRVPSPLAKGGRLMGLNVMGSGY